MSEVLSSYISQQSGRLSGLYLHFTIKDCHLIRLQNIEKYKIEAALKIYAPNMYIFSLR